MKTRTCSNLALQSFDSLRFDKPEKEPQHQAEEDGKGKGKAVVETATPGRCMEEKLRRKCQAKSVRDCKIHRGKHKAHLVKSIDAVRRFGSCPSPACFSEPLQGLVSLHALTPPPLLGRWTALSLVLFPFALVDLWLLAQGRLLELSAETGPQ